MTVNEVVSCYHDPQPQVVEKFNKLFQQDKGKKLDNFHPLEVVDRVSETQCVKIPVKLFGSWRVN